MKGAGTGIQGDALGRAAIGGEFLFEARDFRTEDELATFEDVSDRGIDLRLDAPVLGFQIEVGY